MLKFPWLTLLILTGGAVLSCKSTRHETSPDSSLKLISGEGKAYKVKAGISVCFMQTAASSGWDDVDELNTAFKEAVEGEWGKKVGVVLKGWKPCAEMPDAMVKLNFFDCKQDGSNCPDANKSPHVAFIGPPAQGTNIVNLRRTYEDHYRFDECNGKKKILGVSIKIHDQLASRKRCTKNYGIHEFGHILGFDHEQFHPDGPAKSESCDNEYHYTKTGPGAARWLCSLGYDDNSVMNYCGKTFLNWDGGLSNKDIDCAKEFFKKLGQPL